MNSASHGDARDLVDLEHECKRFRICIIGRTGVGKSTLLGKVFGFDDKAAKVSGRGEGRGKHNVWDPIHNDERNRALIIHDSGGFEAGESQTLDSVMDFIKFRGNQASLAEQLHCIWYCIPLDDPRPIQSAEEDFFKFFSDKQVPLVFVFTKNDKLIRDYLEELAPDDDLKTPELRRKAEQLAKSYVSKIREQLQRATGGGVTVQEVSKKDDELVKALVKSTTDLVKPNLKSLLIRAQGVSATAKREECIRLLPAKFNTIVIQCSIPGNVFKIMMLSDRFTEMFRLCSLVWNIRGQETLFVREDIINKIRDTVQSGRMWTKVFAIIDAVVPLLTAPVYVRLCLKMACDLVLVFQQLFWTATRTVYLREKDLQVHLEQYANSKLKETVHQLVDGCMTLIDLRTALDTARIRDIIEKVVENGDLHLREIAQRLVEARQAGDGRKIIASGNSRMPLIELPTD